MNLCQPRQGSSRLRRRVIPAIAGMLVLLVAIAIAALGAGPGPVPGTIATATSSAAVAFPDLAMVTVPPTVPVGPASPAPSDPAGASAATSASAPPSTSPTPGAAAAVRANRITISRLGIDLPIVEGDGIDTPIGKAAHYPGTAWPGGGSNIYLYAHARTGMFIGLWKARAGDRVDLRLVDGTTREYVVTKVLAKVSWNALQYLDPTPSEQLTLQTCTSNTPTAPRFIVVAVPAA